MDVCSAPDREKQRILCRFAFLYKRRECASFLIVRLDCRDCVNVSHTRGFVEWRSLGDLDQQLSSLVVRVDARRALEDKQKVLLIHPTLLQKAREHTSLFIIRL